MDGGCGATLGDRREEESGARVCRWGPGGWGGGGGGGKREWYRRECGKVVVSWVGEAREMRVGRRAVLYSSFLFVNPSVDL